MNRNRCKTVFIFFILFFISSSWRIDQGLPQEIPTREQIIAKFSGRVPREWGEAVKGVKIRLNTDQKVLALTFDACGGPKGNGYDARLIDFLVAEAIPVTLFISGKWTDANPEIFQALSTNPLFEVENHGLTHRPCSATGRSVYGIKGTKSVRDIYDEIEGNGLKILNLTGRRPKYYRPGAAYNDEICVEIASALGYEVVSFSVRGDAGATHSKRQVEEALLHSASGSIILMHMNHPEGATARGVSAVVPELKKCGFRFVKLSEFDLR
ncbi:MAG TPA: polysaccharide deacetylase family protein [Thermodesulfobacteriota bacterium]|nr:polysaccharide deacetylase family protein [Thermodesulfobacteriota bacterium]